MRITVDNREYEVREQDQGKDLLTALLHLGVDVPYFCWHPALGSVGACRQCAVKLFRDEKDQVGRIEMACMVAVKDGLRVAVEDPEAVVFRRRVIEWLMVNHPHDCPVCDEGGECHLQDMTVMTGHVYRRYRGKKRTYRNQYLGPFVTHEMNRCIQCYRCVRFYREYAGGTDFDVFASKNHVYFGRFEEGVLESEFAGNLVEVCPTGVFTDKTLAKHYVRKWDLETAPSICPHCALGCNTLPAARGAELRRIQARVNHEVNGYFLCDRGRFGYEYVNDPERLRQPRVGRGAQQEADWAQAMEAAKAGLQGCRRVLGIGSPRASLEANYALQVLVGAEAFSTGMAQEEVGGLQEALRLLRSGAARSASLHDAEGADVMFVLGTDPTQEAPMLDLAMRQGLFHATLDLSRARGVPDWNDYPVRDIVQEAHGKLFLAAAAPMKLEALAEVAHYAAPPDLAAFAWGVAAALTSEANDDTPTARVARGLREAKRALVVVSASGGAELFRAAGEICRLLTAGRGEPCLLSVVAPECNSLGLAMLGGLPLEEALAQIESGEADGLVVLENDLFRRAPAARVAAALRAVRHLVALDSLATQTTAEADVVLPITTAAESTGTYVSSEGRAQRFFQVFVPSGEPQPSWRVLRELVAGPRANWGRVEEVTAALAAAHRALAGVVEAAPPTSWRGPGGTRVARQTHRASGRTADYAAATPETDPDSPLSFSMEGFQQEPPPAFLPRYWQPGWNSVNAASKYEVETRAADTPAPGARLLDPGEGAAPAAPGPVEGPLGPDEIWVVPRAAIFGSEELSRRAPAIAELTPPAAVTLCPEEAAARGLAEGDWVQLGVEGTSYHLRLRLQDRLRRGVAVVPAGYPETAGLSAPVRARIGRQP